LCIKSVVVFLSRIESVISSEIRGRLIRADCNNPQGLRERERAVRVCRREEEERSIEKGSHRSGVSQKTSAAKSCSGTVFYSLKLLIENTVPVDVASLLEVNHVNT
jgi:hypothetical protein